MQRALNRVVGIYCLITYEDSARKARERAEGVRPKGSNVNGAKIWSLIVDFTDMKLALTASY